MNDIRDKKIVKNFALTKTIFACEVYLYLRQIIQQQKIVLCLVRFSEITIVDIKFSHGIEVTKVIFCLIIYMVMKEQNFIFLT
jgi:hypothetical protein